MVRTTKRLVFAAPFLAAAMLLTGCNEPGAVPAGQDSSTKIMQANGPNPTAPSMPGSDKSDSGKTPAAPSTPSSRSAVPGAPGQ